MLEIFRPKRMWRRRPELKDSYDVIIIGGGSHGLATAYYLARVLSDRGQIEPARQLIKQALSTPRTFITRDEAEKWLAGHPEPRPADTKQAAPAAEAKKKGA